MKTTNQKLMGKKAGVFAWNVAIVAIVALSFLALWKVPHYIDQRRFANIDGKKTVLEDGLNDKLAGNVASLQQEKLCFNTGEGPYDNGYLWCQTSTIFKLKHDVSPEELGSDFLKIGSSFGVGRQATGYELPLYIVELTDGTKCSLGIKLSSGEEVSGARRNPFNLYSAEPTVAVTCGNRAKAKHYPYMD